MVTYYSRKGGQPRTEHGVAVDDRSLLALLATTSADGDIPLCGMRGPSPQLLLLQEVGIPLREMLNDEGRSGDAVLASLQVTLIDD